MRRYTIHDWLLNLLIIFGIWFYYNKYQNEQERALQYVEMQTEFERFEHKIKFFIRIIDEQLLVASMMTGLDRDRILEEEKFPEVLEPKMRIIMNDSQVDPDRKIRNLSNHFDLTCEALYQILVLEEVAKSIPGSSARSIEAKYSWVLNSRYRHTEINSLKSKAESEMAMYREMYLNRMTVGLVY